jgi:hypothetical protein
MEVMLGIQDERHGVFIIIHRGASIKHDCIGKGKYGLGLCIIAFLGSVVILL